MRSSTFRSWFIAALLCITTSPVMACRPDSHGTDKTGFENADIVFRALVTRAELSDFTTKDESEVRFLVNISYELKEVFKGAPMPRGKISTAGEAGSCGISVWPGQEYIFFVKSWSSMKLPAKFENVAKESQGSVNQSGVINLGVYPFGAKQENALAIVRALAK